MVSLERKSRDDGVIFKQLFRTQSSFLHLYYAKHIARNHPNIIPKIKYKADYLLHNPPKKEIIKNNQIKMEMTPLDIEEIPKIFILIRRVRNNLFHGGKYKDQEAPDPIRDEKLVKACLGILLICLKNENPECPFKKAFCSDLK